jgi:hypothetical protein
MKRHAACLIVCLGLLLIIGCSQYVSDISFVPQPAVVDAPTTQPQQGPPPASMLVSVIGVRYDDPKDAIPPSIEIRLRVDDNGPGTLVFDPMSSELSNGQLQKFPPPLVRPQELLHLLPMQSDFVTVYFPFPPGYSYDTFDISSLQLRWRLQIDGKVLGQGVNFRRAYSYYRAYPYYDYGPYWYYPPPPPFFFGGGVVIVHHR